jgi:lipopolysaccharide exporter
LNTTVNTMPTVWKRIVAPAREVLGKSRVFSALGQNSVVLGVDQVLRFLKAVILARILLPQHFGVFGMALSINYSVLVLSSLGLKMRFISVATEDSEAQRRWLETIWTIEIIRGTLLGVILISGAGWLSNFFEEPQLYPVLLVIAVTPLLMCLGNPGMFLFEKQLLYGRVAVREVSASVAGFASTVVFALLTRNAMALALGALLQGMVSLVLSYHLSKFRPRLLMDRAVLRNCLSFGKHMILVGILGYVLTQFDKLSVGKFLGSEMLGFYIVAYTLAMLPVTLLGQVVNRVVLPYYSEAWNRGDTELAFVRWARSTAATTWLLAGITLMLWAGRGWLIPTIYGPNWTPATGVFGILVFAGLASGLTHTTGPILIAAQRINLDAALKVLEAFLFVALLLLLIPYLGIVGAGLAALASFFVALTGRLALLRRWAKAHVAALLGSYARVAVCFGVGMLSTVAFASAHPTLQMALAILSFSALALLLDRGLRTELGRIRTLTRPSAQPEVCEAAEP